MDADRFDALTKTLSTVHLRRSLTRLLGGLSLGGVLSARSVREVAAGSRIGGAPCDSNTQCATGKCSLGSGKCSCSKTVGCKQPTNRCKQATCDVGTSRCVTSNKSRGTACPADDNPCTRDICDGSGVCIHPKKADGTDCGSGKTCQNGVCSAPPPPCGGCPDGKTCLANNSCAKDCTAHGQADCDVGAATPCTCGQTLGNPATSYCRAPFDGNCDPYPPSKDCTTTAQCPTGEVCATLTGCGNKCFPLCPN